VVFIFQNTTLFLNLKAPLLLILLDEKLLPVPVLTFWLKSSIDWLTRWSCNVDC